MSNSNISAVVFAANNNSERGCKYRELESDPEYYNVVCDEKQDGAFC